MRKKIKLKSNNKGFTLIETLAVVIILGVLLLVAVPSISKYVDRSRKNTYISSVKSMVNAVSVAITSQDLPYDIEEDEAMIIPFSEIKMEKKNSTKKSPYANWVQDKSFIMVLYDGDNYNYYVSALDEAGYAIPLIKESDLTINSITTDKDKINANCISHSQSVAYIDKVFDTDVVVIKIQDRSEKIIKAKVGKPAYSPGNVIQLNDGSKWFVIANSAFEDDTVSLVSYYSMATGISRYGEQDNNNPKIKFHTSLQAPAFYDYNASIYIVSQRIIDSAKTLLIKNNIDLYGAEVDMPKLSDFGCTAASYKCPNAKKCFKGDTIPFWTTDTNGEWVYTIQSDGRGNANTNSTNYGIRLVIRDLLKSNIDKAATRALN
ncbi:MAG: prepilin-type N-terminal cleavage/methylation domain-containing protein [Bacilli bacterium]|nr:prepilin-type N-terminal cleavage/methylation domain-containing protein [Bacilli bacterium]